MYGYGVLKMSSRFSVERYYAPTVGEHGQLVTTQGNHRLNGDAKAVLDLLACALASVVRNLRIFVHLVPDAVADKLANNAVSITFAVLLHRITYISQTVSYDGLLNAL